MLNKKDKSLKIILRIHKPTDSNKFNHKQQDRKDKIDQCSSKYYQ